MKKQTYKQGFIDGQNSIICSETIQKEIEEKCLKSYNKAIEEFEKMIKNYFHKESILIKFLDIKNDLLKQLQELKEKKQ